MFLESNIIDVIFSVVPITRTNIFCSGFENTISECSYEGVNGDTSCRHKDDIFIVCNRKLFSC